MADLLLENPHQITKFTAAEMAANVGISNATAGRFFKRLGYRNFREARRMAREDQGKSASTISTTIQIATPDDLDVDLNLHMTSDIQNITRTFTSLPSPLLLEAVDLLAFAEKIWVVGFDDNYPLAHFARSLLIRIKPDIRMIPIGGFPVPEEFASITPRDTILVMGFRRRTGRLMRIMESAKTAGAKTIIVTDHGTHTPTETADVVLRCRTLGASLFDSFVAPVSLMAYICATIASKVGNVAIERLHFIENLYDVWGSPSTKGDRDP